ISQQLVLTAVLFFYSTFLLFRSSVHNRHLHSFPTRRSSDLPERPHKSLDSVFKERPGHFHFAPGRRSILRGSLSVSTPSRFLRGSSLPRSLREARIIVPLFSTSTPFQKTVFRRGRGRRGGAHYRHPPEMVKRFVIFI